MKVNCDLFCKGCFRIESYRFSYAMRHTDARGWGIITNNVLKMRRVIESQSLYPATPQLRT